MFRFTQTFHHLPLYHRGALALGKGAPGFTGNWGARGKFVGKIGQVEVVTSRRSIAAIDRDMMNYVHRLRIRHRQMRRIFSQKPPAMNRIFEKKEVHMRAWLRKFQLSYRAYVHYATMRTLKQQAVLVNKYGQAAVNRALGDYVGGAGEQEGKSRLLQTMHRAVRTPPNAKPVKKHVVTRFQKHNDRFDLHWKQNQK